MTATASAAPQDWGEASEPFDEIASFMKGHDLTGASEAQTRYDVINRVVREVLGWRFGQVSVEEHLSGARSGYVDYLLRTGDHTIVIEAKKVGAAFPSPTIRRRLKRSGSVLGSGEIAAAIKQAEEYATEKKAHVLVATNGLCWVMLPVEPANPEAYATVLFPFEHAVDAEQLFDTLSESHVAHGSLERVASTLPALEDRLLAVLRGPDARVDRNNIADHILPALTNALHADALLGNPEHLARCFITTEARTKFDRTLGMYLADPKPLAVQPARRIRKGKERDQLEQIIERSSSSYAPPVTLIIGPVGAGKSTYLKHFELISGRQVLTDRKVHWIYVDFEQMGRGGNPRSFLYSRLRDYLTADHPANPTDFKRVVEPAYREQIAGLARGPLALIFTKKDEFNRKVSEYLQREYDLIEPYVDRVLQYLTSRTLCVLVLDNIDLFEDDALETAVLSEGLALSKRVLANVIVCVRDKTFVRHKNDSALDAYQFTKLWLDPPPFKAVLSARLTYSKKILAGSKARIGLAKGMFLAVPDLSVFFDIVQHSILRGSAGDYVDSIADLNIRRGLTLVTSFLTSGHIQADRALKSYIEGDTHYYFPFHEVFKGTMLGQWLHYKEQRSECVNLFDSRLGAKRLRLLRLWLLAHLITKAQSEHTLEVPARECVELLSAAGASESQVLTCLGDLCRYGLARSLAANELTSESTLVATRSGGYYVKILSHKFVYVEQVMLDTAIESPEVWRALVDQTEAIETEGSIAKRMALRVERIEYFLRYLASVESDTLDAVPAASHLRTVERIRVAVLEDARDAARKAQKYDGE